MVFNRASLKIALPASPHQISILKNRDFEQFLSMDGMNSIFSFNLNEYIFSFLAAGWVICVRANFFKGGWAIFAGKIFRQRPKKNSYAKLQRYFARLTPPSN